MKSLFIFTICLHTAVIHGKAETITDLGKTIVFPSVKMENCELVEAIDFLRIRTRELGPPKTNINMVILADKKTIQKTKISKLSLKNARLETLLTKICDAANFRYTIDQNALIFLPKGTKRNSPLKKDDKGIGSKKLDNIIIPFCSFDNTSIEESIDYLNLICKQTDPPSGLKLILKPIQSKHDNDLHLRIPELKLRNATLRETLAYICEITDCTYSVEGKNITIQQTQTKL